MSRYATVAVSRIGGMAMNLALLWSISRQLPIEAVGAAIFALTTANLLSSTAKLGQDLPILRAYAEGAVSVATHGVFWHMARRSASVAAALGFVAAIVFWALFDALALESAMLLVPTTVATTVTLLLLERVKAAGQIETASLLQTGIPATIMTIAVWALGIDSVDAFFTAMLLGTGATALLALLLSQRVSPRAGSSDAAASSSTERPDGTLGVWLLDLSRVITIWAPMAALATFGSATALSLYAAAWRLANVSNVAISTLQNIQGPQIARLLGVDDRMEIEKRLRLSTRALPITLLAAVGAGLVLGPLVLPLLGEAFADATTSFTILLAASAIRLSAVTPFLIVGLSHARRLLTGPALATIGVATISSLGLSAISPGLIALAFLASLAVQYTLVQRASAGLMQRGHVHV